MESPTAPTAVRVGPTGSPIARGIACAPIGLGYFSLVVFWWVPFSGILSTVGLALGVFSLVRGTRGPRGENYALAGTALCAASIAISLTLNQFLRYLMWDQW
jgi:hypothetical protein